MQYDVVLGLSVGRTEHHIDVRIKFLVGHTVEYGYIGNSLGAMCQVEVLMKIEWLVEHNFRMRIGTEKFKIDPLCFDHQGRFFGSLKVTFFDECTTFFIFDMCKAVQSENDFVVQKKQA